ncbi:MAG: gliding motility protein GldN [Prevotellaceae bacterium]|nr:gliding motility protein GldN [Prevotellaceae bacterium]
MKRTRIYFLIAVACFTGLNTLQAQEKLSPDSTQLLFDSRGSFNHIKTNLEDVRAKVIEINPRVDDVVWRKMVLRVIDLRERQNRPLYFPYEDISESSQKNLFSIIFSHVLDGSLTPYKSMSNAEQTFVPPFTPENQLDLEEFLQASSLNSWESIYDMVNYVSPGVVKFYIQEMWYFNKATSMFYNKIMAIAPLYDENYNDKAQGYLRTSVFFWVPFGDLRPFLQEEFIKINGRNTTPLVDFDNFLVSRQFNSYIIKDYDITAQDIDHNIDNPDFIFQEQNRVEGEILDFEQDLWHY